MKNISTIVSAVLLTSTIYAQNINITTGWQLVGTQTAYSNMDNLNKSCIDLVWKYNKNTSTWSAYSPDNNTAQLITDSTTIDTLNNINENDGFWVKANSDCNISNNIITPAVSVDNILNTEYSIMKCNTLLGCSNPGSVQFTSNTITGIYDGENFNSTYEKLDSDIVKITWSDDNSIEYFKIVKYTDNTVTVCTDNDTEEEALNCTETEDWVLPSYKDTYIANQNITALPKTLVTDFSEIQNKPLFQIEYWGNSFGEGNITIDSNGNYSGGINNTDNYNATFNNGTLHVTGWNQWEQDNNSDGDVDSQYKVYKYSLAGYDISIGDFADGEIFDSWETPIEMKAKKINFTSGYMYCHILWSECWLDQNAHDQMKIQVEDF
jgi:hypothetical protein